MEAPGRGPLVSRPLEGGDERDGCAGEGISHVADGAKDCADCQAAEVDVVLNDMHVVFLLFVYVLSQ